ncbi:hypothetical protein ACVWWO_007364 [Bradyrhizobium sp. F1.13.1]
MPGAARLAPWHTSRQERPCSGESSQLRIVRSKFAANSGAIQRQLFPVRSGPLGFWHLGPASGPMPANKNLLDRQDSPIVERSRQYRCLCVRRFNASGEVAFHPKLPCHPVCRSRSASPPGVLTDAASSSPASCGAPMRQDCIETSAKSEVVTVCSWQFAGEERLQSTAMILITTGEPHRCDGHLPG